jgi:hypothetical protein
VRRLVLIALTCAVLPGTSAAKPAAVNNPLLGLAGDTGRFQAQTGQRTSVPSVFLGWGQGQTWGSPFARLFATLGPIPMVHIGTKAKRVAREAISPQAIAQGRGDSYLFAYADAIAAYNARIYVRVLAEMNNPGTLYSPRDRHGRSRGPSHSPAQYVRAFRRVYLILHGGTAAELNAKLSTAGLPGVSRDVPVNPASRLTVIWNPVAGISLANEFYPGNAYVDMVGNDMYASTRGVASYSANEQLYRRHASKPYALPEWGLHGIDDETFVRRICAFLKTRPRTRLAAYYEARPGSPFDLASKPKSRAEYKRCVTPIGAAP